MTETTPNEPPKIVKMRSPRTTEEYTQYLGMVVFLCSWVMLFGGLFMAYGVIRSRADHWPPPDQPALPKLLGFISTVLVVSASIAWQRAIRALRSGSRRTAVPRMLASLCLGAMFLAVQLATWTGLAQSGLSLSSGAYASIIFGLTGFHALHVLVAMGGLAYCVLQTWRGLYNAAHLQPVRLWGLFWHLVAGVWCFTFLAVYLA